MSSILEARGLTKRFGALQATDGVSLQVRAGARLALIGPNGAGKSTLVGLLTGQLRPDAGSVLLNGRDVTRDGAASRARQGLIRTFQINNLFRGLTVLENVFLAVSERLGMGGVLFRPADRCHEVIDEACHLLDELGLGGVIHQSVAQLPYGQQRLLEIAIALSLNPKVLLLDEPAAGVPSAEVARVMDMIEALPSDLAIVMIEHDMHVVRRFAAEVTVLVAGSVLLSGKPHEVMASEEVRRVYLGGAGEARAAGEAGHA